MADRYCVVSIPISGTVVVEVALPEGSTPTEQVTAGVDYLNGPIKTAIDAMLVGSSMPGVDRFDWSGSESGAIPIMTSLVPTP